MMKNLLPLTLGLAVAMAQPVPPSSAKAAAASGSISGAVKDLKGSSIPGASVVITSGPKRIKATTDAQGHYALRDLPPGRYGLMAWRDPPVMAARSITLLPGQDLFPVDLQLQNPSEITGRVLDENKEPVSGIWVFLVGREYQLGAVRYSFRDVSTTDDKGEYRVHRVVPGTPYLILAKQKTLGLAAISDVPAEPKLRRRVPAPTYHTNSTSPEGAQQIVLRPGESRERVDIQMLRSPSYCIEGVLEVEGRPTALNFEISEQEPSSGIYSGGAVFIAMPQGTTGPDGRIRICDLHRGEYRLTAKSPPNSSSEFFGTVTVEVTDHDVRRIAVPARARLPLSGKVAWDEAPPEKPVDAQLSISLQPLYRAQTVSELGGLSVTASIPGEFSFGDLLIDDYEVRGRGLSGNLYLKDLMYGGTSILHKPLRLGSAAGGAELRVIVARDGGMLSARLTDKDGNPVPDAYIFVVPAETRSESELAAMLVTGQTDQNGVYSSSVVNPGKYYVLASSAPFDQTPESIGKLWRARLKAKEVQVSPNSSAQVALEASTID